MTYQAPVTPMFAGELLGHAVQIVMGRYSELFHNVVKLLAFLSVSQAFRQSAAPR